ncbi:hypothetical protein BDC45DRAFT_564776 [Circinella umbellata]|nr:hypothetical protein BDC45DRAFT_564776 [Circinella umbellata]
MRTRHTNKEINLFVYNESPSRAFSNISNRKDLLVQYHVHDHHDYDTLNKENSYQAKSFEMTKNLAQEEYKSVTNTGEGESSTMKVVKRKNIYMYETPPIVKRQAKDCQNQLKFDVVNDTFKLPTSALSLVEKDNLYHKLDQTVDNDILFTQQAETVTTRPTGILGTGMAVPTWLTTEGAIQNHSVYFIECILISKTSWAFITQADLFVQNKKNIDDCAQERRHEYYEKPRAFMIDKTHHDKSWKEFVVRWGNYEYLALGGYAGLMYVDIIRNDREFEGLVPSSPVSYVQSAWYLRSYAKSSASKPWSYTSKRHIRSGFEACHGLAIDNGMAPVYITIHMHIFTITPALPQEQQPLDYILNHLPRSEFGLTVGKWQTVWPALIRVLREIDYLSHPNDDFDMDEPAPEDAMDIPISSPTQPPHLN